MYQAGVRNIYLYENTGVSFVHYDALNLRVITDLQTLGTVITVENMQRPEFDISLLFSKSGYVTQNLNLQFYLLGLTLDNYDLINQLKKSIHGFCLLVEFYDGDFRFYNAPLFCNEAKINPHKEMSFEIKMSTKVPTKQMYYEYTPGISLNPVYRCDSEILTCDSEIYSCDYEL
jgi:hypothetical protein